MVDHDKRDRPKSYIDRALDLLFQAKQKKSFEVDIVEIGCMRQVLGHHVDVTTYVCCNDGHSTYLFARTGWRMISVDNDLEHIRSAQTACCLISNNVRFFNTDALDWAKTAAKKKQRIGLLFIDAWDLNEPGSAEKHLEFFNLLHPVLNDDCMILIDDTDLWYDHDKQEYFLDKKCMSGKGRLLVPRMLDLGYEILFKGRQTLLKKKP